MKSSRAPAPPTTRVTGDLYDQPYESSPLPFNDFRDEFFHCRSDDRRLQRSRNPLGFAGLDTSTDRVTELLQGLSDEDVLALPDLLGFSILEIDALAV
ncbi:hypothetical protein N7505_007721 [Penicillium chrysogenum]|uniref:Uncharacterized protein n=1 Tax=Penicillium chrysogenum TaxID=5076 RepID=A0ABQ8WFJ6_PENCH|nr:hypothetical protein N7505_007721 [Penicillium chrysogenum]